MLYSTKSAATLCTCSTVCQEHDVGRLSVYLLLDRLAGAQCDKHTCVTCTCKHYKMEHNLSFLGIGVIFKYIV